MSDGDNAVFLEPDIPHNNVDGPPVPDGSDLHNKQILIDRAGDDIRYCPDRQKWLIFDDELGLWRSDATQHIRHLAETVIREEWEQAQAGGQGSKEDLDRVRRSASAGRLRAMIDLATTAPSIVVRADDLDADPMLLNVRNGAIDLRTGELRPSTRADLCSKLAPVTFDPAATAPTFQAFLETIFEGNKNVIAYVQRIFGYLLTGETKASCFFIGFGSGANGKSTLLEVARALLGDYAGNAQPNTFLRQRDDTRPRGDLARLAGVRLVTVAEIPENRQLDEGLVKQLTGGDRITARFLYGHEFEYLPQFKLFVSTNYLPRISGTDEGIWRRTRIIRFPVRIPKEDRDPNLLNELREELPGILNWAIEGCLAWRSDEKLAPPHEVAVATFQLRQEEDIVGVFLAECCVVEDGARCAPSLLYGAFKGWCSDAGREELKNAEFARELRRRGFEQGRTGRGRFWKRIDLGFNRPGDTVSGNDTSTPLPSPLRLPDLGDIGRHRVTEPAVDVDDLLRGVLDEPVAREEVQA